MGNKIGGASSSIGKRKIKIMKVDGEIFKLKTPAKARDALKDYPDGYVLLESESVKKFGIRAPKLRPEEELKPKKVYFLVDIPKFPHDHENKNQPIIQRSISSDARSSGAKERLERMMLRQKSAPGRVRQVKMRVPRGEIEKLMEEGGDEGEVAERILQLCLHSNSTILQRDPSSLSVLSTTTGDIVRN